MTTSIELAHHPGKNAMVCDATQTCIEVKNHCKFILNHVEQYINAPITYLILSSNRQDNMNKFALSCIWEVTVLP